MVEVNASMNDTPVSALALVGAAPAEQVEQLMTPDQVMEWLGVSRWWIDKYSTRAQDPLPWIGTKRIRRMQPSALITWMARNQDA